MRITPKVTLTFKKKDFGDWVICLTSILAENVYLVLGAKRVALIDTSLGTSGSLRKKVKKITSLPLFVINTHGHLDRIGGDGEFADCDIFLNNKDINLYQNCYCF